MPRHPKHAYTFTVEWGGTRKNFIEVLGLNITVDVSEFRNGADPNQVVHKMPGHTHYGNIILKRNILKGDNDFFTWMNTTGLTQVERRDIVIKLLKEKNKPVMSWKAVNAFPVRLSGPVLNANASDVAMEELELAHEGLIAEVI